MAFTPERKNQSQHYYTYLDIHIFLESKGTRLGRIARPDFHREGPYARRLLPFPGGGAGWHCAQEDGE